MPSQIDLLKILYFSEKGVEAVKRFKVHPVVPFSLAVLLQSFPSMFTEMTDYLVKYVSNAAIVALTLAAMISVIFMVMKALGTKVRFGRYFGSVSAVMFLVNFVSIALAFLLINLGMLIGYPDIAFRLVQGSFIVYYLFVVFAWASERLAGFDEPKAALGGIASLALIYVFHLVLSILP